MENYARLSIDTHLFFARIMKEHALFLQAGFPCKDDMWIKKADWFRCQFEDFLKQVVKISNGVVGNKVLESQEIVTRYTLAAEKKTSQLSGIPINTDITLMEQRLYPGCQMNCSREMNQIVSQLNEKALSLLDGFIDFKEKILKEVLSCQLFTFNYPLLIEHITREAKLYRSIILELTEKRTVSYIDLREKEEFWNQIMMEHALFIRGLLDPTEEELIKTADEFAMEYKALLEEAKMKDCRATMEMTGKALKETIKYRGFKTAGTEGILQCKIESIIIPLLADHVLREANHYIRILEAGNTRLEG